jgi:pyridoxine 5-phosphate synthase
MVKLSVNINKIATIRNARGGNVPNLVKMAEDIQKFGADGITIHPRPDERHIRYSDAINLGKSVKKEFNIEGNPIKKFIDLVLNIKPTQVTLVPDSIDQITSNAGWDTKKHQKKLKEIISEFKSNGIRTSIFVDPNPTMVEYAKMTGSDRVELYTESFAVGFENGDLEVINDFIKCSEIANSLEMKVNAGHDLNLKNIEYFSTNMPFLDEVSIGHALISESIYFGIDNVINLYIDKLNR